MKTQMVLTLVVVFLASWRISPGYPTPAVVQKMDEWTLETRYTHPEQLVLNTPETKTPRRFWYIIVTVTNTSSQESVEFFPVCQLVTDTFEVIGADTHVPSSVFKTIKCKHQGSYPFLESLDFKDHRIFRGKDNARDFAIIWPDFDSETKAISLFIEGLSNETAVIEHPEMKDDSGRPKKIFLQKTLQLKYVVGGDEKLRSNVALKQIEQEWVMR